MHHTLIIPLDRVHERTHEQDQQHDDQRQLRHTARRRALRAQQRLRLGRLTDAVVPGRRHGGGDGAASEAPTAGPLGLGACGAGHGVRGARGGG